MTPSDSTTGNAQPHDEANLRVGFLVVGRKRPGFDPDWARQMEEAAWAATTQIWSHAVRPKHRALDDPTLRRALDELRQSQCDLVLVLQPAIGDGRLAPILAQLCEAPLVLWATPERPDGGKVSSCSLVAVHCFASLLRQLDRPFEIAYGHPDEAATREQLTTAARLGVTSAKLRRAKVGLVGQHAPGFSNMAVDPAAMSRQLGVQLHHLGLREFCDVVEDQDDQTVQQDVARVVAMGLPLGDGLVEEDLAPNSRYYLAMRALFENESLDALAVRCWPELPDRFGQWPYLAMSRLADEGRDVALEGDVDGAVCCLIARLLGLGPAYISDWLEHDRHTVTLWHPGHAPSEWCEPGTARLGKHFNTQTPLVVNATLAADRPITIFRLWRCDGTYQMTARNARTIRPRRELAGNSGLAAIDEADVHQWFDFLCHAGMPHHVVILSGRHAELLKRLAAKLRVGWVAGSS